MKIRLKAEGIACPAGTEKESNAACEDEWSAKPGLEHVKKRLWSSMFEGDPNNRHTYHRLHTVVSANGMHVLSSLKHIHIKISRILSTVTN